MGIIDVFSKRNKKLPDVYTYDELPSTMRAQIVHIFEDAAGDSLQHGRGWQWIAKTIAHEHGILDIPESPGSGFRRARDYYTDCLNYVLQVDTELALDMVEVVMRIVEGLRHDHYHQHIVRMSAEDAIADLNHRFRENGCGYQYDGGQIIRVDSQLLHSEAVKPALTLLIGNGFDGPNQEFLVAHEHLRHGRYEAAVTEACKAFESAMKAICDARKWKYDGAKATASALIKILIDKELVPNYSEEHLRALEKCLIGLATVRNKNSGHGGGAKPRNLPEHVAAYALHLAATNIVFLIESHRAK
jgi:hypothetical protein